jgi:hypothetical protein
MRHSSQIVFRAAFYSWMAVSFLALTPTARAQQSAPPADPVINAPATQPSTMRFKRYVITDDQGFKGVEVLRGVMPVDWTVQGGVIWKMALGPPDLIRIHWSDAQDVCAFDVYPFINFTWSDPRKWAGRYQVGQITPSGMIIKEPLADQFDAFDKVIVEMFRPDLKDAKVVSKEKMPKVAKAIYDQINNDPNYVFGVAVGRETFEYESHGQTIQEIVSGIVEETTSKQYGFNIWSISQATSERAPKATFDQLAPINAVMVQSLELNPAWTQQLANLIQQRQARTMAAQRQQAVNQQQQFNAIESRIHSQTAANDAQHESYWQHSADLNRQSENEADVQREVSPWKDGDGTTYKLPTQYGHAWSGADGEIIMNNDPSYNPNSDSSLNPTNWTPMEQSQN